MPRIFVRLDTIARLPNTTWGSSPLSKMATSQSKSKNKNKSKRQCTLYRITYLDMFDMI